MASPQSTASHEDGGNKPSLEQITFRFCAECSNMLYPKEDEDAHKLQFTCRTCQYTEEATSTCVFRNVLNNAAGETAGVTQDVGSDPTVGSALSFSAFPAPPAFSSSGPPHKAVVCLCCGGMVVCRSCGELLYVPQSQTVASPTSPTISTSDSDAYSCSDDATETSLCEIFDYDNCSSFSFFSDEYEFENGTEYGNRDEDAVVFGHEIAC
ncbi:DNA directed RNA polymerase 2 [Niveomyces insectorum RCEF 264]|uniref:DNA directed RNA polymerase 2 n=1 Tax=Niveomyces insectorum RCEF 264 TaxID=1081102 RepID=A0A167NH65_9HYPO|nr:DNA directed RNA polymerase 2 [Niveomyces insectorum RCEF 264]